MVKSPGLWPPQGPCEEEKMTGIQISLISPFTNEIIKLFNKKGTAKAYFKVILNKYDVGHRFTKGDANEADREAFDYLVALAFSMKQQPESSLKAVKASLQLLYFLMIRQKVDIQMPQWQNASILSLVALQERKIHHQRSLVVLSNFLSRSVWTTPTILRDCKPTMLLTVIINVTRKNTDVKGTTKAFDFLHPQCWILAFSNVLISDSHSWVSFYHNGVF